MRARRAYRLGLLVTAILAVGAGILAYGLDLLKGAELSSVDTRFDVRGERDSPDNIVFVEIDDSTFNRLRSQFPLPRIHHADAIRNLDADGASVIAYDVQFTEPGPDLKQDEALILATRRAGNVVLATTETTIDGKTRIFGGGRGLALSRGVPAHADFPNDSGGVIRRVEPEVSLLQTFPLAAAELEQGGEIETPNDEAAWIDFAGPPGTIDSIPFWRVALGRFEPGTFTDKIVVVGASATSLQDLHPTSTTSEELMPGPEIQANAIITALDGFPLSEAPGWVNVLLIAVMGALAPLLALRIPALRAVAVTVAVAVVGAVAAQLLFNAGTIVTLVYPALSTAISSTGVLILFGLLTAFERERVRDAFARFVPESVVGRVLDQAEGVRLGGVATQGTVMFSDIRGFTTFSERRPPEEVIEILNRYLTAMSDVILDHGGTLVAYMGDGIMAVFGAPIEQADHADRGVAAACGMLEELNGFNEWVGSEYGEEPFRMGIGLNTGKVMSGNVGSERRLEYTTIGDVVNTAARLEGMTKGTPYQLYIADSTRTSLTREPPEELEEVGEFAVRGRNEPIMLWTLPSTKEDQPETEPEAGAEEPAAPETVGADRPHRSGS